MAIAPPCKYDYWSLGLLNFAPETLFRTAFKATGGPKTAANLIKNMVSPTGIEPVTL